MHTHTHTREGVQGFPLVMIEESHHNTSTIEHCANESTRDKPNTFDWDAIEERSSSAIFVSLQEIYFQHNVINP